MTDPSKSEGKRRPIEERIAALMGKSAHVDLNDGVGGTSPLRIRDSDVAAALGAVSHIQGKHSAMVLETKFGSTLIHADDLLRLWERKANVPFSDRAGTVLARFAGALGIRQYAGMVIMGGAYTEYAYLIFTRREALQTRVAEVTAWLEGMEAEALREFRVQLRERMAERRREEVPDRAA